MIFKSRRRDDHFPNCADVICLADVPCIGWNFLSSGLRDMSPYVNTLGRSKHTLIKMVDAKDGPDIQKRWVE